MEGGTFPYLSRPTPLASVNLVDGGPCWFALTSTDCPTSEAIGSVDRIISRCAEQTKVRGTDKVVRGRSRGGEAVAWQEESCCEINDKKKNE